MESQIKCFWVKFGALLFYVLGGAMKGILLAGVA